MGLIFTRLLRELNEITHVKLFVWHLAHSKCSINHSRSIAITLSTILAYPCLRIDVGTVKRATKGRKTELRVDRCWGAGKTIFFSYLDRGAAGTPAAKSNLDPLSPVSAGHHPAPNEQILLTRSALMSEPCTGLNSVPP